LDGTLAEIRTEELGFTPEETQDLLSALDAPVAADTAAALSAETQGWAVGLRLAAAPLKQGVPAEELFASLARDDGSIAQYLFAEVLAGQPASVRRILLRISVTSELWPDLVDRLCGRPNVRRVLAGLVHLNAFVEAIPGVPGGFRIHPLFQEMLQGQLSYNHPGEVAGLHRTCAEWYAEHGQIPAALSHAAAAGDWAAVTRLLVDDLWVPRVLAHGTDTGTGSVTALPQKVPGSEAAVVRTVTAVTEGRSPAPSDVAACRQAWEAGNRLALRVSAGLAFLSASAAGGLASSALVADVEGVAAAVAELPDDQGRARRDGAAVLWDLRARGVMSSDVPIGQLLTALRSAVAAAQSAGARRLRARALGSLALVEALAGHLTRAAQLAGEAEAFAVEDGEAVRDPAPALALAWVHLRRYALAETRECQGRVRERTSAGGGLRLTGLDALSAVLQAQQLRLRHEYDAADQLLRPYLTTPRPPRWVAEQVLAETVRLAVARGEIEEGLRLLEDGGVGELWRRRLRVMVGLLTDRPTGELLPGGGPSDSPFDLVETSVLRACQLLETGRPSAAADELATALDLARPEVLRWPFVDTPPQARRLLRTHPRLQELSAWLNPASGAHPRAARSAAPAEDEAPPVVQELSDREMEVLRYLAEMLSTAEIAATMFISVNTVRTHIRSILRKLSVSRRNQAVRRARERGLL
jgi:LuxR family maltose regulon positive regulatory protein